MASFPETVGGWLLDLMGFVGLALGGAGAAATPWLDDMRQQALNLDPNTRLTPAQLAEQVVKGITDEQPGAIEAAFSGISPSRFSTLVKMTGNPPGPGELLDMLRRDIIDEPLFEHGIRQGYIKTEWVEQIRAFRWQLLGLGDAVAGVVQNHLDAAVADNVARAHGVTPADFGVMVENAGNPPGAMEALDLWRRGDIDEPTVDQMLRESRLKNKYIDALKKRVVHLVPMRTITTLLTHGAITDARALEMLQQLGFLPVDAQAIIDASHFAKASPDKTLSVATIRTLYTDHLIDRGQAVADLAAAHYPETVATQILDLADREIANKDRASTILKIRNAYLARRIDRANASGDLDKLGVASGQRDGLLALWDIDLENNVSILTPAQIVRAGKMRLFTEDEMLSRLVGHGYTPADAVIVAIIGGAIAPPPPPP